MSFLRRCSEHFGDNAKMITGPPTLEQLDRIGNHIDLNARQVVEGTLGGTPKCIDITKAAKEGAVEKREGQRFHCYYQGGRRLD